MFSPFLKFNTFEPAGFHKLSYNRGVYMSMLVFRVSFDTYKTKLACTIKNKLLIKCQSVGVEHVIRSSWVFLRLVIGIAVFLMSLVYAFLDLI